VVDTSKIVTRVEKKDLVIDELSENTSEISRTLSLAEEGDDHSNGKTETNKQLD
jgi:hypothetical protein